MNLCVVGTGYVGLVTGTVFSDLGYTVFCADTDADKIGMLKSCKMPFYEPGLEEMVRRNLEDKRLFFSTDIASCVRDSEIVFIAVGTPPAPDGYADLTGVCDVARTIAKNLFSSKLIVIKSTVPVGTADMLSEMIANDRVDPSVDFDVVSNPEFLREGNAIADTLNPDRVVIGASNTQAAMKLVELYTPLGCPIVVTDVRSAEIIKYASNAFLATKISYINAIAIICELANADVLQVAKGIGLDHRIGSAFLNAGLGWGGSCFGKDTMCMVVSAERLGYDFQLLKSVIEINRQQPDRFVRTIIEVMGSLKDKDIGVLGLAFKPNTDDLRDGQSLEVIRRLRDEGARIRAYDPIAMDNARKLMPDINYCESAYAAAEGADALVLVTEWNEFKFLDFARIRDIMRNPILFDGRNMFDPARMRDKGMQYYCIGRPRNNDPNTTKAS